MVDLGESWFPFSFVLEEVDFGENRGTFLVADHRPICVCRRRFLKAVKLVAGMGGVLAKGRCFLVFRRNWVTFI